MTRSHTCVNTSSCDNIVQDDNIIVYIISDNVQSIKTQSVTQHKNYTLHGIQQKGMGGVKHALDGYNTPSIHI